MQSLKKIHAWAQMKVPLLEKRVIEDLNYIGILGLKTKFNTINVHCYYVCI